MRALNNTGMTFGDLALAFALTAGLVFGVILLTSVAYAWASSDAGRRTAETVSESHYGVSFKHDDHLWFRAYGGSALHHPDCPCGGAK